MRHLLRRSVYLLIWIAVFSVFFVGSAVSQTAKVPKTSDLATNPTFLFWILGGVAALMIFKGGLEFFGILPPPNKREIDKISAKVSGIHADILDGVGRLRRQETHDRIGEIHELIVGPIAEVCKNPTAETPPAWCTAHRLEKKLSVIPLPNKAVETLHAQNTAMTVRLLESVLDRQDKIEQQLREISDRLRCS